MKKLIVLFVLLIGYKFVIGQVLSTNPMRTGLDSVVDKTAKAYMLKKGRVGLSIGIVTAWGRYKYHYGEIAPGTKKLPDDYSIYEIGSITKTFTGLLVAQAIVDGKMELNADIRKYLPARFSNLHYAGGEAVKLGSLLAHTAQLPFNFEAGNEVFFLQQLEKLKLDSLRPAKYAYSNVGYKLLGYALEQVYQLHYDELLARNITSALKMKDTRVSYANKDRLLQGFDKDGKMTSPISAVMPGAGAIHSNLEDMLKYTVYQLAEKDAAVKLSHRVIYGNVDQNAKGLQWDIGKTRNWDYYIRADGGTEGFRTFCALYPNEGTGIVLLSNQTDDMAGGDLYAIIVAVLSELKSKK